VMQANNTLVSGNTIYNFPYSGISIGWTWGFHDNYTSNNTIEFNYIHDVMRQLADGGAIYTLGPQPNTVIRNNYIADVKRSEFAIGSLNNGFFFDEGSSMMLVDSNVVKSAADGDYRFNQTDSIKIKFGRNYFEQKGSNNDIKIIVSKKLGVIK